MKKQSNSKSIDIRRPSILFYRDLKQAKGAATVLTLLTVASTLFALQALAKTPPTTAKQRKAVRFSELDQSTFEKLQKGELNEILIEFQEGDRLPISLTAGGDLVETIDSKPQFALVKRHFFIQMRKGEFNISFDGETYRPVREVLSNRISAGAQADDKNGIVTGLTLQAMSVLKPANPKLEKDGKQQTSQIISLPNDARKEVPHKNQSPS